MILPKNFKKIRSFMFLLKKTKKTVAQLQANKDCNFKLNGRVFCHPCWWSSFASKQNLRCSCYYNKVLRELPSCKIDSCPESFCLIWLLSFLQSKKVIFGVLSLGSIVKSAVVMILSTLTPLSLGQNFSCQIFCKTLSRIVIYSPALFLASRTK